MPPRIILIGGGEHARVVAEAARSAEPALELVGFVDPEPCETMVSRLGVPRLGDDSVLPTYPGALGVLGFGAIGDAAARVRAVERLTPFVGGWAVIVHRTAIVSPDAVLGPGSVVMAGAMIQTGVSIGTHCVVNTGAILDHDVQLGNHVQVGPGAILGGGVMVGREAYIALGAAVRDHVRIGNGALVGMGAAVVADVEDQRRVMGVPAR